MNAIIERMMLAICLASMTAVASAQTYSNRIGLGVGALYERGFDATLSVEHETKNHNAWEYFINGYVKYDKDTNAGHITNDSFWKNYRTWGVGVAYKPCVFRGKNNYGALRIGGSAGSDTHEFMGCTTLCCTMASSCLSKPKPTLLSMDLTCSVQACP